MPHEPGRTKVHKIKKSSLERGEERGEKNENEVFEGQRPLKAC
jgi:hypothetical protein